MTTVVAVALDGRVVLGADQATNVYDRPVLSATKIRVLTTTRGQGSRSRFALAFAGDGALPSVVTAGLTVDAPPEPDADMTERNAWAAAIARAITELAIEAHLTDNGRVDGNLILAHDGRVWTITHMQAIPHPDGMAAVGSGEGPALGAVAAGLELGATDLEKLVDLAVRIAIERDRYSGGEPQLVTI